MGSNRTGAAGPWRSGIRGIRGIRDQGDRQCSIIV
jgi:hypothetical protein